MPTDPKAIDIPWDEEEAWGELVVDGWPEIDRLTDARPRFVHRLDRLPDGTEFVDRMGAEKVKVGDGPVQGSVVVCDGAVAVFCQYDGGTLVRYANADEAPREEYRLVTKVLARDAEEAKEFIDDLLLNDVDWDSPLEVTHVGNAIREADLPAVIKAAG